MWGILFAVIVPCRSSSSTSNQEEDFRRMMRIGNGKGVGMSELQDDDTSISGIGNNGEEMLKNIVNGHDMEFSVESDPVSLKPSRGRGRIQKDSEDNGISYSRGDRGYGQAHGSGGAEGERSMSSDTRTKKRERRGKKPESDDESISVEEGGAKIANAVREKGDGRSRRRHRPEEARNSQGSYPASAKAGHGRRYKESESNRTGKKLRSYLDSESTHGRLPKKPGSGKKSLQKGAKRENSGPKDSEVSSSNFVESIKKMKRASKTGSR